MADNKVYVLDAGANQYEAMTKEQIITAITQAVNDGTISNIDAGFITKIQEMNKKGVLKWWVGTQAEFNALGTKDADTLYLFTDDPLYQDLLDAIDELTERVNDLATLVEQGGLNRPAITQTQFVNFDYLETTNYWRYDGNSNKGEDMLSIMIVPNGDDDARILCIPSTKSLASATCEKVSGDDGYITYDYQGTEDIEDSGYGQVKFKFRAIKPCIGTTWDDTHQDFIVTKSTTFRITITDIYGHQFVSPDFTINYKVAS